MKLRNLLLMAGLLCFTGSVASNAQGTKTDPTKKMGKMGKMDGKKMPPRDPKTGRFMKKGAMPAGKMDPKKTGKMGKMDGKKMPPRDPKTGRFMKKGAAPKK